MPEARLPITNRADYAVFRPIVTRWMDNDALGHINNATYYSFFDTAVTGWLLENDLLGLREGALWVVAESGCRYLSEIAFPDPIEMGLKVERLGGSSVRYGLGVFRATEDRASAQGHFVHVHVDRIARRPSPIPEAIRLRLAELQR